jgi:hypothetical protein
MHLWAKYRPIGVLPLEQVVHNCKELTRSCTNATNLVSLVVVLQIVGSYDIECLITLLRTFNSLFKLHNCV